MHKGFLAVGALLGGIAVALGAFGAHGLQRIVSPDTVSTFQTGVQYQMYHGLALIAVAAVFEKFPNKLIRWAAISFCIGILLFSGSLYVLTFLKTTGKVGLEGIGIITPFGGIFFILGWLLFFLGVVKREL
jgi:uncharacterized membrane protein YgdD (TMEM256/DUF423 family)